MDSCPLQGAPRPSPSAFDLAIPAAVERALVSPTRCPGLTPARVQSVRQAPTELGGQRGGVRAGRAWVRAAEASAGGACDHGARGWARSAARWRRRGEQWRPRALESRPRCWGCCCCGGSAGWDVPGARGSRQSLSPRRRPAKPQVSSPPSREQTMGSGWLLSPAGPERDSYLAPGVGSHGRRRSLGRRPHARRSPSLLDLCGACSFVGPWEEPASGLHPGNLPRAGDSPSPALLPAPCPVPGSPAQSGTSLTRS